MKTKQLVLAASCAALSLGSLSANAAVIVDLFSTNQATLFSDTNGDIKFSQAGGAADTTILGGYRDLSVAVQSGGGIVGDSNFSTIGVSGGILSFGNQPGTTGLGEIVWDGATPYTGNQSYALGLGNVDLTQGGTLSEFVLTTLFSDLNWNFEIIAYTSATAWTAVNLAATPTSTAVQSAINFAAFTTAGLCGLSGSPPLPSGVNRIACGAGGTANLTQLNALVVRLNVGANGSLTGGTVAVDLQLAGVEAGKLPEPATLGMFASGLLALGLIGMRRRDRDA